MSKVLQRIIDKFIIEQLHVEQQTNTNDPICAMIKQTDSQNTIQIGKPGTNQPGGQIQAQTALSSEKAIAKQNGAVDAFIIVTCLKTGDKYDGAYIKTLITKLFKEYTNNMPWIQSYATTEYFCLLPQLSTPIDDSMIIPVWIYSQKYQPWTELNPVNGNNTKKTPNAPIEMLQSLSDVTNKTFTIKPQNNSESFEFSFKNDLKDLYKFIKYGDSSIKWPGLADKKSVTYDADGKTVVATTLTYKQLQHFFTYFYRKIKQSIQKLANTDVNKGGKPWVADLDLGQIKTFLQTEVDRYLPTFPSIPFQRNPEYGKERVPLPLVYLNDMIYTYKTVPSQFKNIQKQLKNK